MSDLVQPLRGVWRALFPLEAPKAAEGPSGEPASGGVAAVTPLHAHDALATDAPPRSAPAKAPLNLPPPEQSPHSGHVHTHPSPPASKPTAPVPDAEPTRVIDLAHRSTFELDMHPVRRRIAGVDLTGISYGGSSPGPVLRVKQGSEINVMLRNNTDSETTLHPHGLRVDWRFDGVPHIGQDPVQPGGSFNYKLTFPDAGVYWYHPHVRDWAIRGQGAYGVFVVQPTDPNYYNPVNREEVLALQDIALQAPSSHDGGRSAPTHVFGGLYGETMLVNGQADYKLDVKRGDVVRFHVVNAADARVFNLAFPGARMKVIGSDIGKNEREEWADSVMISPAERYTVEVLFDKPGTHEIVSKTTDGTRVLGKVEVDAEPTSVSHLAKFERLRESTAVKAEIDQYRRYFDRPADKRLVLAATIDRRPPGTSLLPEVENAPTVQAAAAPESPPRAIWQRTERVTWEEPAPPFNSRSNADNTVWKLVDPDTGAVNQDIQWTFDQGEPVKIAIQGGPQQHPIHFHGQRFLVLSINGVKNPNLQWKDTVLVPTGQTAEILLDNSNPGPWMFHCHIGRHALDIDHSNHRMTGFFNVRPRKQDPGYPLRARPD